LECNANSKFQIPKKIQNPKTQNSELRTQNSELSMIRILVTGSKGQLGSELQAIAPDFPFFDLTFTDLPELDITDETALEVFWGKHDFDAVINCAAYTAVDKAEEDVATAGKVNRDAVANLARLCNSSGTYLVHISTDYVFDGRGSVPYRESDRPNPQTAYGHTKLAGEEALMACLSKGMILRTSWLYSSYGNNFVKTILRKAKEGTPLRVVSDQVGNPTYARDLAKAILHILPVAMAQNVLHLLHYSNEGICSWYDFAVAIVSIAGIGCEITPVTTEEYPLPAPRPGYSALDKNLIRTRFNLDIPSWKDSLSQCLKIMPQKH
jgi:dTDP-4-dehydrorhamnose reductase